MEADSMTITLDEDVAAKLAREAERTGSAPQDLANEALRRNLDPASGQPRKFVVHARNLGTPLIDLECTGRALEMLDVDRDFERFASVQIINPVRMASRRASAGGTPAVHRGFRTHLVQLPGSECP